LPLHEPNDKAQRLGGHRGRLSLCPPRLCAEFPLAWFIAPMRGKETVEALSMKLLPLILEGEAFSSACFAVVCMVSVERDKLRTSNFKLRTSVRLQPGDRVERQHMRPAQIVIRARRRKSVEMRPADRGKQQRIRLRGNDAVKAWIDGHLRKITASRANFIEFKLVQSFSNTAATRFSASVRSANPGCHSDVCCASVSISVEDQKDSEGLRDSRDTISRSRSQVDSRGSC